mmetsp:Transcript_3123/g.10288  ORF Transcript_3123/g.10288 Transcript_3123/m.10288 type:complete len:121 (+) Transcript_3123:2-364(+)
MDILGMDARPDDDLDDILAATTGDFDVVSEDGGGGSSIAADHDLDDMLQQSTGDFNLSRQGSEARTPGREGAEVIEAPAVLRLHLQRLGSPRSGAAIDELRSRIRELTARKQSLYRALTR